MLTGTGHPSDSPGFVLSNIQPNFKYREKSFALKWHTMEQRAHKEIEEYYQ